MNFVLSLMAGAKNTEKEWIVRVRAFTTRPPIRSIYRVVLQRNRLDFVKIILLKSDNCVLTMRKRLFCVAKLTLLTCKTAAFGIQLILENEEKSKLVQTD